MRVDNKSEKSCYNLSQYIGERLRHLRVVVSLIAIVCLPLEQFDTD